MDIYVIFFYYFQIILILCKIFQVDSLFSNHNLLYIWNYFIFNSILYLVPINSVITFPCRIEDRSVSYTLVSRI